MRLGGRLQAAIDVLQDIETRKRPAADALKDWGLSHRFAGSGDRAAIGNIVYDALRKRASISWRMNSIKTADIAYGALLVDGGMTLEAIQKLLEDDRFAPDFLSKEQLIAWESRHLDDAADHIRADVPEWCTPLLAELLGESWIKEASLLSDRPPLDLRVNTLKSTLQRTKKELAHVHADIIGWFNTALRIAPIEGLGRHPNVQAEPAFQKGWFEVQDLGSQIAAHLVQPRAGMQVLDYCAGAGGKTMALAADMENRGQIYAYDAEKARLAPIFARLQRAGVRNAQMFVNSSELDVFKKQMDIVVVDAPCTGTGTWRRRPDAKWRLTAAQLERRCKEQRDVLDKAKDYLKPGGRLVYITCSLLVDENDHQVQSFCSQNLDFHVIDMQALWQQAMAENAPKPIFTSHGLVLSPASTDTDGFFISIMDKAI